MQPSQRMKLTVRAGFCFARKGVTRMVWWDNSRTHPAAMRKSARQPKMIPRCLLIASLLLVPACGSPPDPPYLMRQGDWRRTLVGSWVVTFRADSLQTAVTDRLGQTRFGLRPGDGVPVTGTLQIADTVVGPSDRYLGAVIALDFTAALGRQVSCFHAGRGSISLQRERRDIVIDFTPGAADCGLRGLVRADGDSLVGTWYEDAFVGHRTAGRMVWRHLRPP